MLRSPPSHFLQLVLAAGLGLASSGCLAPALSPIHPMTADAAEMAGDREIATTLGYAPAPGGGLGDSVIPGTPYAEGEVRWAVVPRLQLTAGVGISFQRYFLPWLNSISLGTKFTAYQDPDFALAFAPRVVGASAFNLASNSDDGSGSLFGTRSLGFELPVLMTHRFTNGWALTFEVWGRFNLLRQEDATVDSTSSDGSSSALGPAVATPVDTGNAWGAGGAVMFSFPKLRGSSTRYHVFLGVERLWLTQTSAEGGTPGELNPLVTVNRYSLAVGLGTTTPW